jgi:hypothetical protein
MTATTVEIFRLKTLLLRSSQRLQATRSTKESNAFRWALVTTLREVNHHCTVVLLGSRVRCWQPSGHRILNHVSLAMTHWMSKWSSVSTAWSQRAQGPLFRRPCRCSQFDVQHWPWSTNQMKKQQVLGVRTFHNSFAPSRVVWPMESVPYAESLE